jgi:hypothetical protein
MYKKMTIGMAVIMAGIALTTMTTSMVFATTDEEPDPNTVGKATKQANEDFRDNDNPSGGGEHASDPTGEGPSTSTTENCDPGEPGRCGLALNRGNEGDPEGSPQETICAVTGGDAPGCP